MKICICCKFKKEYSEFTIDNKQKDNRYSVCKICLKEKRILKKENKRKYDIEYRLKNKDKLIEKSRNYQKSIPNEIRTKRNKKYRQKNKDKFNKWQLKYIKKNKYKFLYRTVLNNFLVRSGRNKNDSAIQILGYDYEKFKLRIEFNFKEGMSWENHGKWHVDHKKPISKFNVGISPKIVNALSNLQPLWANENLSKGNKF
jgi:hypothetical protein